MEFHEIREKHPLMVILSTIVVTTGAVIAALSWLDDRMDSKIKGQSGAKESSTAKQVENALPVGAVIAFYLPDGCPKGWIRFDLASGRAIVGVGEREFTVFEEPNIDEPVVDYFNQKQNSKNQKPNRKRDSESKRQPILHSTTYHYDYNFGQILPGDTDHVALFFCRKASE